MTTKTIRVATLIDKSQKYEFLNPAAGCASTPMTPSHSPPSVSSPSVDQVVRIQIMEGNRKQIIALRLEDYIVGSVLAEAALGGLSERHGELAGGPRPEDFGELAGVFPARPREVLPSLRFEDAKQHIVVTFP